jgi:bifunctional non-homologous end joining protein LigD
LNRGCGSVHAFKVRRAIDAAPGGVASRGEVHEVKFDGYRSQLVIEDDGTRVFTRNGQDWTAEYRDLVTCAESLGANSANVDGEIIVLNEAGLSDFSELRKAITRRQHDLYFVAFDLLHLNGHDLRDMALEERARSWPA